MEQSGRSWLGYAVRGSERDREPEIQLNAGAAEAGLRLARARQNPADLLVT
jgi:hypothetical protein